jgi:DNA replication protein DnaC
MASEAVSERVEIHRAQYEQLATRDFIRRRVNVVLVGQSGVGKSHLGALMIGARV